MKRKLATTFAVIALAPFALVACGDDEEAPPATPAPEAETGTPDDAEPAAGGSTIEITADPSGGLAYEETSAEADAGTVTIDFTNDSSTPHDVIVEGADGDIGGTDVISNDTTQADVELEAGDYTFYCSVPGHRESGMEGTLTVK